MERGTRMLISIGAGIAAGALLGVLFAPNKGTDTRKKIKDASDKLSNSIKQRVKSGKDDMTSLKEGIMESIESINQKLEEYI